MVWVEKLACETMDVIIKALGLDYLYNNRVWFKSIAAVQYMLLFLYSLFTWDPIVRKSVIDKMLVPKGGGTQGTNPCSMNMCLSHTWSVWYDSRTINESWHAYANKELRAQSQVCYES